MEKSINKEEIPYEGLKIVIFSGICRYAYAMDILDKNNQVDTEILTSKVKKYYNALADMYSVEYEEYKTDKEVFMNPLAVMSNIRPTTIMMLFSIYRVTCGLGDIQGSDKTTPTIQHHTHFLKFISIIRTLIDKGMLEKKFKEWGINDLKITKIGEDNESEPETTSHSSSKGESVLNLDDKKHTYVNDFSHNRVKRKDFHDSNNIGVEIGGPKSCGLTVYNEPKHTLSYSDVMTILSKIKTCNENIYTRTKIDGLEYRIYKHMNIIVPEDNNSDTIFENTVYHLNEIRKEAQSITNSIINKNRESKLFDVHVIDNELPIFVIVKDKEKFIYFNGFFIEYDGEITMKDCSNFVYEYVEEVERLLIKSIHKRLHSSEHNLGYIDKDTMNRLNKRFEYMQRLRNLKINMVKNDSILFNGLVYNNLMNIIKSCEGSNFPTELILDNIMYGSYSNFRILKMSPNKILDFHPTFNILDCSRRAIHINTGNGDLTIYPLENKNRYELVSNITAESVRSKYSKKELCEVLIYRLLNVAPEQELFI